MATATFVATDTTTQGSWRGVYGADGYRIANKFTSDPAWATITLTGTTEFTWSDPTSDAKALQYTTGSNRVASTWYTFTSETFRVNISDGNAHRVRLYLLDWDSGSRAASVAVKDHGSGSTLDTRSVAAGAPYTTGVWLSWDVTGDVDFVVTLTGGSNITVSGIFFDTVGGGSTPFTVSFSSPAFSVSPQTLTRFNKFNAEISAPAFGFTGRDLSWITGFRASLSAPAFNVTPRAASFTAKFSGTLTTPAFSFTGRSVDQVTGFRASLSAPSFSMTPQTIARLNAYKVSLSTPQFKFTPNSLEYTAGGSSGGAADGGRRGMVAVLNNMGFKR